MNSQRANHFGNHLIRTTVEINNIRAPASPMSTFSKNDLIKAKATNTQSIELLFPQLPRETMPSSFVSRHYTVSSNASYTDREPLSTSSQGESSFVPQQASNETSMLLGSTITTAPMIGLPSHYPGSVHDWNNRLENNSVLLEELQDFDDIFGQAQSYSSNNSLNHEGIGTNRGSGRESSFNQRAQSNYDDDDDDLHALSQSLPSMLALQHRRNVSELSCSSLQNPVVTQRPRSTRSLSSASMKSTSSIRSHRRSRNLAMGSTEFQNAVLEELEY